MKATIRGVRYDTDKAILVGGATHDVGEANPSYWRAKLYRQPRSGRYFLVGHGGSMTVFTRGGERLMPLYLNDAIEWSRWHLNGKL